MADLEAGTDPKSTEIAALEGFEEDASVLFVGVPASSRGRGLDNLIASLPPDALRNSLTVLALHPAIRELLDDDALDDIFGRVSKAPLFLLTHDEAGCPTLAQVRGERVDDINGADLVFALREADVMSILIAPGAHLPATERLHYRGPNDYHYGAFLRPGFALTSNSRLDRMSFWLLPYMRDRTNILVDHWSMLALAHHAAAYASRFFNTTSEVFVEALRGYETVEMLSPRMGRALRNAAPDSALFLLSINSTGTLTHDVVLPALDQAGQQNSTAVALAESATEEIRHVESLASLDETFTRQEPSDCSHCEASKMVLPIDRDTFLMKLAAYTMPTAITRADTSASTPMIEAYKGIGAFSLHRDYTEAGSDRHHAFYVDLLPMLTTKRFKRRLLAAVGSLEHVEPQAIVCPPTDAARQLAAKVAELLDLDPARVVATMERGLDDLQVEQRDLLAAATDILLVDDVVITGSRIKGFRQELTYLKRKDGQKGDFNFGCLTGVARARDEQLLRACTDTVHHQSGKHNSFAAVETLFLPNWDERSCPWCEELRTLQREQVRALGLEVVETRIAELCETEGLVNPFFSLPFVEGGAKSTAVGSAGGDAAADPVTPVPVPESKPTLTSPIEEHADGTDEGTSAIPVSSKLPQPPPESAASEQDAAGSSPGPVWPPNDSDSWHSLSAQSDATAIYAEAYWDLNPGSVFGNLQGVDLVTSVAAAVNSLRTAKKDTSGKLQPSRLDEPFRPPVSKVLHPDLYLFGRFMSRC